MLKNSLLNKINHKNLTLSDFKSQKLSYYLQNII